MLNYLRLVSKAVWVRIFFFLYYQKYQVIPFYKEVYQDGNYDVLLEEFQQGI